MTLKLKKGLTVMNSLLAVTIDTNIFDSARFDFGVNGVLYKLKEYVDEKKIKIFLSPIVKGEVEKHIRAKTISFWEALEKVSKDFKESSSNDHELIVKLESLLEESEKNRIVESEINKFRKFVCDIHAEIVGYNNLDVEEVFNAYFEENPPFEVRENKKAEFPDAFIVQQILQYAKKNSEETDNSNIGIVTSDRGFREACEKSSVLNLIWFESLGELVYYIEKGIYPGNYAEAEKKIKSNKDKIIETIKTEVMKSDREFDISVGDILVEYEDEDYWFYCDEFEVNSVTGVKINDNDIIISEIKKDDSGKINRVYFTVGCRADLFARGFYFATEESIARKEDLDIDQDLEVDTENCVEFKCDFEMNFNSGCIQFKGINGGIQLNHSTEKLFSKRYKSK